MGGGLLQLFTSKNEIHINKFPQFSFFSSVYYRHTAFSLESIPINFNNTVNFGKKVSCIIPKVGDLIYDIFIEIKLNNIPSSIHWIDYIGHKLLKNISIEIGGKLIDSFDGEWMYIWNELTQEHTKKEGYDIMTGREIDVSSPQIIESERNLENMTEILNEKESILQLILEKIENGEYDDNIEIEKTNAEIEVNKAMQNKNNAINELMFDIMNTHNYSKIIFIPLKFWFCRKPGISFPLLSIDSDVKINIEFELLSKLVKNESQYTNTINIESKLYIDYIFIEENERKYFLNNNLKYFIKVIKHSSMILKNNKICDVNLNLNGFIDSLYWTIKKNSNINTVNYEKFENCSLYLDNKICFFEKDDVYLSKVQAYQFMKNIPSKNIYLFSFSLNPLSEQPCGFFNSNNILKSRFQIKTKNVNESQVLNIYYLRYNILEINNRKISLSFI